MSAFKKKVVLITGGSRGIGAAAADAFAREGALVVITARNSDALFQMRDRLVGLYGTDACCAMPADMGDPDQVDRLFSDVDARFDGQLDVLVNNAAMIAVTPFDSVSLSEWRQTLATNLTGVFLASQHAFRLIRTSGNSGAIVNVSSLGGLGGTEKFPGFATYSVSKFGVTGLTECLAVEGRPYGIRVNAIAPGAVDTEMLKIAAPGLKTSTTPEDVAPLILFLANENLSGKLTGAVIPVYSNQ